MAENEKHGPHTDPDAHADKPPFPHDAAGPLPDPEAEAADILSADDDEAGPRPGTDTQVDLAPPPHHEAMDSAPPAAHGANSSTPDQPSAPAHRVDVAPTPHHEAMDSAPPAAHGADSSTPDQPSDAAHADSDSILDLSHVASVQEGASGIIPITELPDPQSSPSLVSWTEVIRQHRETQPPPVPEESLRFDSVSDTDLLQRVIDEESERKKGPPAVAEKDTDELGDVPLVSGPESGQSGSALHFGEHDQDVERPSGSAVQFNVENPPSDAGGAMPNPWVVNELPEAFPYYGEVEGEVPLAELISYREEPVILDFEEKPGTGDSVAKFIHEQNEGELSGLAGDPDEHASILDLLLDEGGSKADKPSDVVDVAAKPDSGLHDLPGVAEERQSSSGIMSDITTRSKKPLTPSDVELPPESVIGGSGWRSKDGGSSRKTMPAVSLPEESVDLHGQGPLSRDISDSGTLQISDAEMEEEARKQQTADSSSIDLNVRSGSKFDLDIEPSAAGSGAVKPGAGWGRARREDSAIFRGEHADTGAAGSPPHDEYVVESPAIEADDLTVKEKPAQRPARVRRKEKRALPKGMGRVLAGTAAGLVVGAGALFAAHYFEILPAAGSAKVTPNPATTGAGGANQAHHAEQASPQQARELLDGGNASRAKEVFEKCDKNSPAVLAGLGQARWLAYLQQCAKENKQPNRGDADVAAAVHDLKTAVDKAKGKKNAEHDVAHAYLWQGMIDETFQDYDSAAKVYSAAKKALKSAASQAMFEAAGNRLHVIRPGASDNVGLIPSEHLLLAFIMLAADEPEDAPKADEPAGQECGFLFWEAMLLAAKHQYDDAAKKVPAIKAVYARQWALAGGKNLNPQSDPRGQMLTQSLDDVQRYWQLCGQLYKHPEAKPLVEKNKIAEAMSAVLAKGGGASKAEIDKLTAKIQMLTTDQQTATAARKAAEEMVVKLEENATKLTTANAEAEAKLKSAAESLDKAGVKDPDLAKAVAAVISARDDAEAVVKGLRERFEKAKYVDANANKDQMLKALDDAITRGSSDAVTKLAQEKKEIETKAETLAAEFDKLTKKMGDVRTPAQLLEAWLPALADKDRPVNTAAALADAESILKNEAADKTVRAKAVAVKAMALRNQGKVVEARSAFEELQKEPGFAKDQPWAKEAEVAAKQLNDPAAFLGIKPAAAAGSGQKALEQIESGLKLFPADSFAQDHARLLAQRAIYQLDQGDVEKAAADADAAVVGGGGLDAQYALARVREKQRKYDESAQVYHVIIQEAPADSDLARQATLGLARVLLDRAGKAAAQAAPAPAAPAPAAPAEPPPAKQSAALPAGPGRAALSTLLCTFIMLAEAGEEDTSLDIHEAIRLADKLIDQKVYLGHIIKADALARLGRFNAALTEYSTGLKALKVLPKEYESVFDRILALHPALQKPDANLHADSSLALKHYGEGLEWFRDGNFLKAQAEFIKAIGYDSKDARYMYFLGLARWLDGKTAAAIEDFKAGAVLEMLGKPSGRAIGSALESIQGPTRAEIEKYRP